jgi:hypothetical protein
MIVDLIIVIVWLMCAGLAYFFFKKAWLEQYRTWSPSDRNWFIFWSLGGPVSLALSLFNYGTVKSQ